MSNLTKRCGKEKNDLNTGARISHQKKKISFYDFFLKKELLFTLFKEYILTREITWRSSIFRRNATKNSWKSLEFSPQLKWISPYFDIISPTVKNAEIEDLSHYVECTYWINDLVSNKYINVEVPSNRCDSVCMLSTNLVVFPVFNWMTPFAH